MLKMKLNLERGVRVRVKLVCGKVKADLKWLSYGS